MQFCVRIKANSSKQSSISVFPYPSLTTLALSHTSWRQNWTCFLKSKLSESGRPRWSSWTDSEIVHQSTGWRLRQHLQPLTSTVFCSHLLQVNPPSLHSTRKSDPSQRLTHRNFNIDRNEVLGYASLSDSIEPFANWKNGSVEGTSLALHSGSL